ncbi:hypothetical protein IFM89_032535 [Coptis chinensis]|uniref:Cytochrome b561 domain-containing protein n=1 Tax=Coptis chinensis TaxID=261450 RepID=A0A835IR93_9MAGN|nr:hypothetical protein IFM89_032535 [Coptis chinensis]
MGLGYALGFAGFVTGLKLGSSSGVQHNVHRNLAIVLFTVGSFQVLVAMCLRPKKDHKLRFYWAKSHLVIGLSILILGIIEISEGLRLLEPAKGWKLAYIAFLEIWGVIVFVLGIIRLVNAGEKWKEAKTTRNGWNNSHP